jgi:hypothetical protein
MKRVAWAVSLFLISGTGLLAQPARERPQGPGADRNPAQMVVQAFERKAPPLGRPLPDIEALDASGLPVRLGRLKGRYTVLVFGCLT